MAGQGDTMNLDDLPIGMIRRDELLNILIALHMSGQDEYTLQTIAQATGLLEYFESKKVTRCSIVIEQPKRLKTGGSNE